jgi:hypothetical protein
MEPVTVKTYREGDSIPKTFGAHYIRANGDLKIITKGERSSVIAQEKAGLAVRECEWEATVREDGVFDVGHGWIDEPDSKAPL